MKRTVPNRFRLLTALFALTMLMAGPYSVLAQDTPVKGEEPPVLTKTMQALLADREVAWNGAPQAATPCVGGMAGSYPCDNVDLLAYLPLATFSASSGNDSWGWTDPLTGKEYALMGLNNGTGFVDISSPENPVYLGKLPTHTSNSSWRDIKVYNNYAFVVSEAGGHGMQVFDLTQLRNVANPPVTFSETAHYPQFGNAHNIVINEATGFAYAVGSNTCSGGLHMVNIQNPTNPTNAGCFSADGYTHDAQCVSYIGPDPDHQGQEICFNANEDTLTIVNVTNKAAPVQVSRTGYPNASYTHQAWVDETHTYLLLDDELDEQSYGFNTRTRIWNISDLESPQLLGYYSGTTPAIDHNLYIKDGHAYLSNYRAGLQILDLSNITSANLTQEAYFDIYPANNNANFNGAWSVFPYYESGVVIISGIEQGLFVVRPILSPDFAMSAGDPHLSVCAPGNDTTTISVSSLNGYNGSVTFSATGLPAGATAGFNPNPVTIPGSSTLTVTVAGTAAGNYPFSVSGTSGAVMHDLNLSLNVSTGPAGTPTLLSPANGANNQSTRPTFTWASVSDAVSYDIEIATDAAFSNVVHSQNGIQTTSYTPASTLPAGATLYWHVRAHNGCGASAYSAAFNFDTLVCSMPNAPIPDNAPAGLTDQLALSAAGSLTDLDISIVASHTWVGDLSFTLTHVDTGTSVVVFDRPGVPSSTYGCSGDDIDTTLDDEASLPVENQCAPATPAIQGTFQPNNPLSAFDGENIGGQWTLKAVDHASGDTGTLVEWCLIPAAPCYDFNASGAVDVGDISLVTAAWGTNNPLYDFNNNGSVDVGDIQIIALTWQVACTI